MYLVDTNVVSDVRRKQPKVVRWLRSVDPLSIYLSVITLGEINRGLIVQQGKDPASAARLLVWLQTLRDDFRNRTLAVSEDVAIAWGRISAGRSRGVADGLIAATAMVHGMVIVTRSTSNFDDIDVPVIDPWDQA